MVVGVVVVDMEVVDTAVRVGVVVDVDIWEVEEEDMDVEEEVGVVEVVVADMEVLKIDSVDDYLGSWNDNYR